MSKKRLLLYRKYYRAGARGVFSDSPKFDLPKPEKSFAGVIKNLIGRKYIHLTETGHSHLLPKGVFVQEAIARKAQEIMESKGAIRYRFASVFSADNSSATRLLIDKFGDQILNVSAPKNNAVNYLKYASDPLIFQYFSGRNITTPLKTYSPDYFFRAIKKGELKPLINPREFYMTDFHFFNEHDDLESFIDAALLNKTAVELFIGTDDWYLNIDTSLEFFNSNAKQILEMLNQIEANAVVNITKEKTHYYSIQNQYIVNYFFGNTTQLANLQFDQKNGGIFSINSSVTGEPVSIVHGTIFGRVEKVIALVFGKRMEISERKGEKPVLPIWLSPIIIRIIPTGSSEEILKFSYDLGAKLKEMRCRFDIDFRKGLSLNQKVKDAEQDWIPLEVIVGKDEVRDNMLSVRDRQKGKNYISTVDSFLGNVRDALKDDSLQTQTTPHIFMGDATY